MGRVCCVHDWSAYHLALAGNRFLRCARCAVVRCESKGTEPRPAYNEARYFNGPQAIGIHFTADGMPRVASYLRSRLPALLALGLDLPHGGRHLLQVGPGIGQLSFTLAGWGWHLSAVETGDWPCRYLAEAYPGMAVERADFLGWSAPRRYDAIVANHALEHFREADQALAKMAGLLLPGGKLYLEVPAEILADAQPNEHAWPSSQGLGLANPDHWWHFAEATLPTWFAGLGLWEVEQLKTIRPEEGDKLMDFHCVGRRLD